MMQKIKAGKVDGNWFVNKLGNNKALLKNEIDMTYTNQIINIATIIDNIFITKK